MTKKEKEEGKGYRTMKEREERMKNTKRSENDGYTKMEIGKKLEKEEGEGKRVRKTEGKE